MTPVSLPEAMALVLKEVTEELVEASLAPDCADSLQQHQQHLQRWEVRHAWNSLQLLQFVCGGSGKAQDEKEQLPGGWMQSVQTVYSQCWLCWWMRRHLLLWCSSLTRLVFFLVQSSYFLWSHLILARGCREEIPYSRQLILLLQKI